VSRDLAIAGQSLERSRRVRSLRRAHFITFGDLGCRGLKAQSGLDQNEYRACFLVQAMGAIRILRRISQKQKEPHRRFRRTKRVLNLTRPRDFTVKPTLGLARRTVPQMRTRWPFPM
jgi:hypothetical protein